MASVSVYNMEGKEVGTIELNDAVFGVKVNEHLVQLYSSLQINVREPRRQRPAARCPEADASPGGRRAQATRDRDRPGLPSGKAAA